MDNILERHKRIWNEKKILRIIYKDWYEKIIENLSDVKGITLELGAGSGNFKEYKKDVISADIEKCDWLDMSFDAHAMPFENESVSNIVMIDVLHHLYNPVKFLSDAKRVLNTRGRLIMLEPYPSAFSHFIYKRFHPEPFIFDVDYFEKEGIQKKDPWDSNQAIPYLIFFKHIRRFKDVFGNQFKIIKRDKLSFVLYPASGGFENKALIPDFLIPVFKGMETLLTPLAEFLAFRCFIVIEKY